MKRSLHEAREKALARKAIEEARLQRINAKIKKEERNADTRRKILAGAVVMERAKRDPAFQAELHTMLANQLARDNDRALFDLPALPEQPAKQPGTDVALDIRAA